MFINNTIHDIRCRTVRAVGGNDDGLNVSHRFISLSAAVHVSLSQNLKNVVVQFFLPSPGV